MSTKGSFSLDDLLVQAILTSDLTLLGDCMVAADGDDRRRAMELALHGSETRCVEFLIPHCDLDETLRFVEWRMKSASPMLWIRDEHRSALLAARERQEIQGTLRVGLAEHAIPDEGQLRKRL